AFDDPLLLIPVAESLNDEESSCAVPLARFPRSGPVEEVSVLGRSRQTNTVATTSTASSAIVRGRLRRVVFVPFRGWLLLVLVLPFILQEKCTHTFRNLFCGYHWNDETLPAHIHFDKCANVTILANIGQNVASRGGTRFRASGAPSLDASS